MRSYRPEVYGSHHAFAGAPASSLSRPCSRGATSSPSSLRGQKAKERRKTKMILVLGIALPVLACIIGIAAWAITTDVLRINPRESNFDRFGQRGRPKMRDGMESRSDDAGVDIFQQSGLTSNAPPAPSTSGTRKPATGSPPPPLLRSVTRSIRLPDNAKPADVISKLISSSAPGNSTKGPRSFVVFAPVPAKVTDVVKQVVARHRPKTTTNKGDDDDLATAESREQKVVSRVPPMPVVGRRRKSSEERADMPTRAAGVDLLAKAKRTNKDKMENLELLQVNVGVPPLPTTKKQRGLNQDRELPKFQLQSAPQVLTNRNGGGEPATPKAEALTQPSPVLQPVVDASESNGIDTFQQFLSGLDPAFQTFSGVKQVVEIGRSPQSYEVNSAAVNGPPPVPPSPSLNGHGYHHSNGPAQMPNTHHDARYQGRNQQVLHPPQQQQPLPPNPPSPSLIHPGQQVGHFMRQKPQSFSPDPQQMNHHQQYQQGPSYLSNSIPHSGQRDMVYQQHIPQQYAQGPAHSSNILVNTGPRDMGHQQHHYPQGGPSYPPSDNLHSGGPQYFAPQSFHTKASHEPKFNSYEKVAQTSVDQSPDGQHHHHHHHHHHPDGGPPPDRDVNLSDVPRNDADRQGSIGLGHHAPRGITLQIGGGHGGRALGLGSLLPFSSLGIARSLLSALLPKPLTSKVFVGLEVGRGNVFSIG